MCATSLSFIYGEKELITPKENKNCFVCFRFSYAIVSINITDLQHRLMMKRKLRTHFYNLSKTSLTVDDYHEVHCKYFWNYLLPKAE